MCVLVLLVGQSACQKELGSDCSYFGGHPRMALVPRLDLPAGVALLSLPPVQMAEK